MLRVPGKQKAVRQNAKDSQLRKCVNLSEKGLGEKKKNKLKSVNQEGLREKREGHFT